MAEIRGVIPILKTPFDLEDRVDEDSLRREVDYCVDAGAHGLGIAFGSELPKLSEDERTLVARVVIDQARGRIPVVMSTGYPSTMLAVRASREAEALGASAVMLIPPANGLPEVELHGYFRAVAAAVRIPIVVQVMTGAHLSGDQLASLARAVPEVQYAKVESAPPAESVAEAIDKAGDRVTIIGGASGGALIEELELGIAGHHAARDPGGLICTHLESLARRPAPGRPRDLAARDRAAQRHRWGGVQGDAATRRRDYPQSLPRAGREPLGRRGAAQARSTL